MKNPLITARPKIKKKGFNPENISISVFTKQDTAIYNRILRMVNTSLFKNLSDSKTKLISKIISGYQNKIENKSIAKDEYVLSGHELIEFENIDDSELFRYLIYRYKYNLYPLLKIFDDYPPSVQIEPVSICNFRCVFCFQVDKTFTNKDSGYMGYMDLNLFKRIIDELEGKVESITLASRGEPTLHKKLGEMLNYMNGKFLAIKINSNASLFTDKMIHTILSNDVHTMAFSIDAAEKELYEKLRVNGKFERTLKNIKRFNEIKKKEYPASRLVTRISGVKVNDRQNVDKMTDIWSSYSDLVAFTNYIPWESSYDNELSEVETACTELWRRLFVWWDGKVNPCDYDYKSILSKWNIKNNSISEIWNSDYYKWMRDIHLKKERKQIEPCKRCIMS